MFLRKILSSDNKAIWVVLDLIIVIIGVYTAYMIQEYAEDKKIKDTKEEVLSALKFQLEEFRISLPEYAGFTDNYISKIEGNPDTRFIGWRFTEPQYSYQILEYALGIGEEDIINFELQDVLTSTFASIKQLEHSERSITRISERYRPQVAGLPDTHQENLSRKADNQSNFSWYVVYLRDRSNDLKYTAERSVASLQLINAQLSETKRKEVETRFIISHANKAKTVEEAIGLVNRLFPDFTDDEIKELFEQAQK